MPGWACNVLYYLWYYSCFRLLLYHTVPQLLLFSLPHTNSPVTSGPSTPSCPAPPSHHSLSPDTPRTLSHLLPISFAYLTTGLLPLSLTQFQIGLPSWLWFLHVFLKNFFFFTTSRHELLSNTACLWFEFKLVSE